MSDVNLATHLLKDGFLDLYDVANYLITLQIVTHPTVSLQFIVPIEINLSQLFF